MAEYTERNIQFFRELISCAHNLYSWVYSTRREKLWSNCPFDAALDNIFLSDLESANDEVFGKPAFDNTYPVIITSPLGLMWITDFERMGQEMYLHVIGPVFYGDVSDSAIGKALDTKRFSYVRKQEYLNILKELPVIAVTRFMEYGLMLHYTLTGDKISPINIQYVKKPSYKTALPAESADMHGTWVMEQALLKLIEEGNLSHNKERAKLVAMGRPGNLSKGIPIRHIKNQIIIYTALCLRAAIKGGLSPETAYTVSDQYILAAEESQTLEELMEVNRNMQNDFIHRVHKVKLESGISRQIRDCCDYIQSHITEKISVAALAVWVGYAENYLSRKFKSEMGQHITEYINAARIDYAKNLLASREPSIQDIAEQLGFGTSSYFGEQFKKFTGITPGQFRHNGQLCHGENLPK